MRSIIRFLAFAWILSPAATAQESTPIVGFVRIPIAAQATSVFAVPLTPLTYPDTGPRTGKIDLISRSTLVCRDARWTPGNLSDRSSPWLVRMVSGVNAGRLYEIASNTRDSITLKNVQLESAGVIAGTDAFELVPVPTLRSFFEGKGLLQGASASQADVVSLMQGNVWVKYFFDSSRQSWIRANSSSTADRSLQPLTPATTGMIERKGSALSVLLMGRLSGLAQRIPINAEIGTAFHLGALGPLTLSDFRLQQRIPGWRSSGSDRLYLFASGGWKAYHYTGTGWVNESGALSNETILPAGACLQIYRESGPQAAELLIPPTSASL